MGRDRSHTSHSRISHISHMAEVEETRRVKAADRDAAIEEIAARLGVRAERGRRFAELTSLRVGGAIDWVLSPQTEEQAAALVHELEQREIAWRPLGSGSNVLADDGATSLRDCEFERLESRSGFRRQSSLGQCRLFAAASLHRCGATWSFGN